MISFRTHLKEEYGYTLYHATTVGRAIKIIEQNTMIGRHDALRDGALVKEGVSFTRNFEYARKFAKDEFGANEYVIFEVDGNKLRQNYKIGPSNSWYSPPPYDNSDARPEGLTEFEERVDGSIKNFDRYLRKIIIPHKPGSSRFGHPLLGHPKLFYKGKFVNK